MSENAAVLVDDDDAQAEREDRWLTAMTKIHACVVGGALFDGAHRLRHSRWQWN